MHIDKNSYGTLAIVYLVCSALVALTFVFGCGLWLKLPVCIFALAMCVWQTLFFRVPHRKSVGSSSIVTSVADGDVVIIDKVYEPEWLKRECIQVSVYMDFWNVHANFWPLDGKVTYYKYHPGKHVLAFKPKASEDNEHSCVGMVNEAGREILFKQLAGTFARRIVCYAKPGLEAASGAQCGIIKFGSRIDMYLPLDSDIKIKLGDKVRACETVIAEI